MSATNKTTHYELPVFLGSDKPAWLVDWNGAMTAIDAAIYEAYTTAQSASTAASSVASDLATLSGTVSTQGTSITTLSDTLTTLVGTVNTITSLIGNGEPTTTDKTIIGAINEINAKIPEGGTTAAGVSYDNTSSGLSATNVQTAIDELASGSVQTTKYAVWMGDSYVTGSVTGPIKRFSRLTSDMLGVTEKNYAVGSSGFTSGTTFATQLTNAINDFTTNNLPKESVDYVIIGGTRADGIISGSAAASYASEVESVVDDALSAFPNATVYIIPLIWDATFMDCGYLESIHRIYTGLFNKANRVKIIDNAFTWLSGYFAHILYQDGANVHPDDYGHQILATHAYNAIKGNNFTNNSAIIIQNSSDWSVGIDNTGSDIQIDKHDGFIHIRITMKVSDHTQVPSTRLVYSKTYNTIANLEEFYTGDQRLWFNFSKRNPDTQTGDVASFIECTVTKTGDATGTFKMEIVPYAGTLANGIYYADLVVKDGVINAYSNFT